MSGIVDDKVSQLAPLEIPVMQSTLQALKALQAKAEVSAAEIAAAILPDPMMALKLMRLANASKRGEFAQRIAIAEHAVMMLGMNTAFGRLGETPALESILPQEAAAGLLRCASRAYHAASHARAWAVQRLDTSPDEVYIATLLQSLGEMALWCADTQQMLLLETEGCGQGREEAEQRILGFPLNRLTATLAERWHMPPLVTAAMQPEIPENQTRPRCVALADRLSRNTEWGWHAEAVSSVLEQIAEARKLPLDDVAAQVHSTAAEVARRRVFDESYPAARWLPMLPGEWPAPEKESIPAADSLPVADPLQTAMDEISRHLDGSLNLQDLMTLAMSGMRDGIGLQRVVFALLTGDRKTLAAKYVVGAEDASPLKAFRFDMGSRHLFSVLMTKSQAIWMNAENRVKYAAFANAEIEQVCSGKDFFAMSLTVHGKVIGLFYADGAGNPLNAEGYEAFKMLCARVATGMEHLARSAGA